MRKANVCLIGCGFMGRTHSNGLNQVRTFFDLPVEPVKKLLCCRNADTSARIADKFGWPEVITDWREAVARPEIDVIDIATPVYTHAEIALAALKAGKAVICEKPMAATLAEARQMAAAARTSGLPTMTMFNLRSIPAVMLARQLIQEGALGEIRLWRGAFLQAGLVDAGAPLLWRLRKELAGSGVLGDLGSHSLDLAQFLVGDISEVSGMLHTFVKERPVPVKDIGRDSIPTGVMGQVDTDDAAWAHLRFANGARGSMEVTKMATGRYCSNRFEVYGSEGGLAFDFMRMNELEYFSQKDPQAVRGWRTIHATTPAHPFMKAWWPAGHSIGYEHTFVHAYANFFQALAEGKSASPDFVEGAQVQAVMDAIEKSNQDRVWETVERI